MKTAKIILSTLAFGLLVACGAQPVHNIAEAPAITASGHQPSMFAMKKAIMMAGTKLGWEMQPVKPGLIVATLHLRKHAAVVNVTYNTRAYSITYKDSTNLDYKNGQIHRNYNGWIENLDKGIRAQLAAM